ncbi:MAG: molecular chaperone DnaK (HSP70) [Verrucomicrobiales bacterium]|jgi:molecular chaperone DnaK (HSP70)
MKWLCCAMVATFAIGCTRPTVPSIAEIAVADSVLSESVGIETLGGVFTPIISAGDSAPANVTQVFSTAADNQTHIDITLYAGTSKLVEDCRFLGRFKIDSIPPLPRGEPSIRVTFRVDEQGSFYLFAEDSITGRNFRIERDSNAETKTKSNKTSILTPGPLRVESLMTIQSSTQKSECVLGQA